MKSINGLLESLNGYLLGNKARRTCFVHMLLGMIGTRTVNLQEIALACPSKAKISSRYRRLQRFFAFFNMDLSKIACWLFDLYFRDQKQIYVLIDRTNWYVGKKKINVFMLSIAYEGLAIPILWELLEKAGCSNFEEQRKLLNRFVKLFGSKKIAGVLADREFGNGKLFNWLTKKEIPFYIRIKEGSVAKIGEKKLWKIKKIFRDLKSNEKKCFHMAVHIFGQKVFLAGSRSERGELMIVATNRSPKNAIAIYLRRWEIESLFQSLKGRGFRFEETHMTHPERIAKLVALLAVGFAWSHKVGEWLALKKPIMFKRFRDSQRPQYTFFRYGLDCLRNLIFQGKCHGKEWKQCLQVLVITEPEGSL